MDLPGDGRERIEAALREGRKIEAIEIYREATGLGLKESPGRASRSTSCRGAWSAPTCRDDFPLLQDFIDECVPSLPIR